MSYNCDNNTIIEAVGKALCYGVHFYTYRMPGESQLHFGAQIIDQMTPIGFYIKPFSETQDCPSAYISAQFDAAKFLKLPVSSLTHRSTHKVENTSTRKEDYLAQANTVIKKMRDGELRKLVLSRVIVNASNEVSWLDVFNALLDGNPNAFVFMFNTEASGAWVGASPERYLSYHGKQVYTMALAGTRKVGTNGDWGAKEIEEQSIVADYISERFNEAKISFEKSDTYTRQAGNVEHICNDFVGNVSNLSQVDKMQTILHPTPALAGMPTRDAIKLIKSCELHHRRYYGGYVGPINAWGQFDFFVNLRSLEFDNERYCLYVGGGLTADSIAEDEWNETEQKAQLLLSELT